jgi:CheY-like chemotaxis protein
LQSATGKGSIFSFEVDMTNERAVTPPLVEEPASASESHSQSMPVCSWSCSYTSSTPKVLIVDDNFMNRLVARKLVESRGYACIEVNNGLEAVQMLVSLQACTFVLMDVEMPEMDGLAATEEIRRLERAGRLQTDTTVVGCSANCSLEDKEAALGSGMNYFLEKPLRREQLFELLSEHFGAGDR